MRIIISILVGLIASSVALAVDVSIDRRMQRDAVRGADIVRKSVTVQLPIGTIYYSGIARDGSTRGIAEKRGDQRFGLSFHRPPRSNGGWDLANFLRIGVRMGGASFEGRQQYLLEDVYVLETEGRTMLRFVWPLDEQNSASNLVVTTVQYPSHRDWLFVRVDVEGPEVTLNRCDLSCHPANTAGPAERERWVATRSDAIRLSDNDAALETAHGGIAYFNKLAQQDAGCFLVFDPKSITSASVSGTYGIRTRLIPAPGRRWLCFALGGFVGQSGEEAVRYFLMERAEEAANFLGRIDWSPRLAWEKHELLFREVEELLRERGGAQASARLVKLKTAYAQARAGNRIADVLGVVRELQQMKQQQIQQVLKTFE